MVAKYWGAMARLIALAGLPGVGKSSLARHLAQRIGAVWLRIDSMDQAIWASGTAPSDLFDWTYRAAQAIAADNLSFGRDIVADCVNDCQDARDGWEAVASRAGVEIIWLEVVCGDAVEHRRRIETRSSDIVGLKLPDWTAVEVRAYDEWSRDRLVVDTAHRSLEQCVEEALNLVSR
jgi:predicted kinase